MPGFLIPFLILCAVVAGIVVLWVVIKKHDDFVLLNSTALEKLSEINKRYTFYQINDLVETSRYDSDTNYNSVSCKDYLIYQLQFNNNQAIFFSNETAKNREKYEEYKKELAEIHFGEYKSDVGKLKIKILNYFEKKRYDNLVQHPQTERIAKITLYQTNINGELRNKKGQIFDEEFVKHLIKKVNNKNGYFFNDREIWDAICRVERAKVSNKMRFSIYKRDGYRCRYCGKSNRQEDLEIDHIYPIAKGGKSTYSNLQTLCKSCNQKKGANIM